MKKFLSIVLLFIGVLVLAAVGINSQDQQLSDEVTEFLKTEVYFSPLETTDNAYPFLVGFGTSLDEDPVVAGIQILNSVMADSGQPKDNLKFSVNDPAGVLGKMQDLKCFNDYACFNDPATRAEVIQLVADNQKLIDRYHKLITYKKFETLLPLTTQYTPNLRGIPSGHKLFISEISLSPEIFQDLLATDIQFWRRTLNSETAGLVEKMTATANLFKDYRLLEQMIRRDSRVRQLFKEELQPLTEVESTIANCLDFEGGVFIKTLLDTNNGESAIVFDNLPNDRLIPVEHYFYKPNATANQAYQDFIQLRAAAVKGSSALLKYEQQPVRPIEPAQMYYNPVGKLLLNKLDAEPSRSFSKHQKKLEELDQLIKQIREI
ncbi:MAG: hypothetical protein ABFS19_01515 [Thermodesulfobacteriota bacterium]